MICISRTRAEIDIVFYFKAQVNTQHLHLRRACLSLLIGLCAAFGNLAICPLDLAQNDFRRFLSAFEGCFDVTAARMCDPGCSRRYFCSFLPALSAYFRV